MPHAQGTHSFTLTQHDMRFYTLNLITLTGHTARTHTHATSQEIAHSSAAVTATLRGGPGVTHPHMTHAGHRPQPHPRSDAAHTCPSAHQARSPDALASQAALSPSVTSGSHSNISAPARGVTRSPRCTRSYTQRVAKGVTQPCSPSG